MTTRSDVARARSTRDPTRPHPAAARRSGSAAAPVREVRLHPQEADRVASLHSYAVLDAAPMPEFDALTRLAALVCRTPTAMISLIDTDRQYTLSRHGSEFFQTARSMSVCSDGVASARPLVVDDLAADPRYSDLPGVADPDGARAYAGMPITGRDGLPLGMLCAVDTVARPFTPDELTGLADLAEQVVTVLELRRCDAASGLAADGVIADARRPVRLRRALDDHEFVPYFQPMVDMVTGRVLGFEALVRWEHPTRGLLPPAAFLPGLEVGLLSRWTGSAMLEAGCALVASLRAGGTDLPDGVAFNMASQHLVQPGVAQRVLAILGRHGLPGSAITTEVTETAEVRDTAVARREVATLREAGVRVVADDFGVGWSNLTRLLQLPLSGLKIDRELVTGMVGDPVRDHMVAAAVALGAAMGLDVIAEGVETAAVRDRLVQLGCRRGQGWLYSRAVPAADVPALIAAAPTRWAADPAPAPAPFPV